MMVEWAPPLVSHPASSINDDGSFAAVVASGSVPLIREGDEIFNLAFLGVAGGLELFLLAQRDGPTFLEFSSLRSLIFCWQSGLRRARSSLGTDVNPLSVKCLLQSMVVPGGKPEEGLPEKDLGMATLGDARFLSLSRHNFRCMRRMLFMHSTREELFRSRALASSA